MIEGAIEKKEGGKQRNGKEQKKNFNDDFLRLCFHLMAQRIHCALKQSDFVNIKGHKQNTLRCTFNEWE